MVAAIDRRTKEVQATEPQEAAALRVVPLTGPSLTEPAYELLTDEVLDRVHITEASEDGDVPTLIVINQLDVMVFLMDGQELIGAKQNRILNTDVLVPANSRIEIPVSCVEQGRWGYRSRRFASGKSASHRTRSQKMKRVRQSLQGHRGHDANQGKVWQEVNETIAACRASSPTHALSDVYASQMHHLESVKADLRLSEDTVGIAIFRGPCLLGIDLFDRHATCRHYWSNLVDSYVLDHLGQGLAVEVAEGVESKIVRRCLDQLTEPYWHTFEAPGEGSDYRFHDQDLEASALVWEDEVPIHVQAFPADPSKPYAFEETTKDA